MDNYGCSIATTLVSKGKCLLSYVENAHDVETFITSDVQIDTSCGTNLVKTQDLAVCVSLVAEAEEQKQYVVIYVRVLHTCGQ